MKKILAIAFVLCSAVLFCSFKCAPVCTGCKNIEVFNENGLYVFHIPVNLLLPIQPHNQRLQ